MRHLDRLREIDKFTQLISGCLDPHGVQKLRDDGEE